MGNTFRRNGDNSTAAAARYAIIKGRQDKARNRREECAYDARAFNARIIPGR